MAPTVRVLLAAAVLSAAALTLFAVRVRRTDPGGPERLIGELRLAQWAALVLAAGGACWIGLAVAREAVAAGSIDVLLGVAAIVVAAIVQQREPPQALFLVAVALVIHAFVDVAHRPGWLGDELAPRWFVIGCAAYDVYVAALCDWTRRR